MLRETGSLKILDSWNGLFQSSVSWRWPKDTWALGTRLTAVFKFYQTRSNTYKQDQTAPNKGVQTLKCLVTKQCLMVFGRQTFSVCPGPRYLTAFHLSPAVNKKYRSFLHCRGNKDIMLHTLARKTKVSKFQTLAWKVIEFKMTETRKANSKPSWQAVFASQLFWGLERKYRHY